MTYVRAVHHWLATIFCLKPPDSQKLIPLEHLLGKPRCNGVQMCREEKDVYSKTATYTLERAPVGAIRCLTLSVTNPCQAVVNVRQ